LNHTLEERKEETSKVLEKKRRGIARFHSALDASREKRGKKGEALESNHFLWTREGPALEKGDGKKKNSNLHSDIKKEGGEKRGKRVQILPLEYPEPGKKKLGNFAAMKDKRKKKRIGKLG